MKNALFAVLILFCINFSFAGEPKSIDFKLKKAVVQHVADGILVYGFSPEDKTLLVIKKYDVNLQEMAHMEQNMGSVKTGVPIMFYRDTLDNYVFYGSYSMRKLNVLTTDQNLKKIAFAEQADGAVIGTEQNLYIPHVTTAATALYWANSKTIFEVVPALTFGPVWEKKSIDYTFQCRTKEAGTILYNTKLRTTAEDLFAPSRAFFDIKEGTVLIVGDYGKLSQDVLSKNAKGWTPKSELAVSLDGLRFVLIELKTGKILRSSELKFADMPLRNKSAEEKENYLGVVMNIDRNGAGNYFVTVNQYAAPIELSTWGANRDKVEQYGSPFIGLSGIEIDKELKVIKSNFVRTEGRVISQEDKLQIKSQAIYYSQLPGNSSIFLSPVLPVSIYMGTDDVKKTTMLRYAYETNSEPYYRSFYKESNRVILSFGTSKGNNYEHQYYVLNLQSGDIQKLFQEKVEVGGPEENERPYFLSPTVYCRFIYDKKTDKYTLQRIEY
jgi:hypothetical protein